MDLTPDKQRIKISQLMKESGSRGLQNFKRKAIIQSQAKTLRLLLSTASSTEFGSIHHFSKILEEKEIEKSFQSVPLHSYLDIKSYWQRAYEGEENICWPGTISYFALSSGTTDAASKYIPVSAKMLKNIKRASVRQLWHIAKTDLPKEHFTKHYLFVGGSTSLEFNGNNYSGDLSGITTSNIPIWMRGRSKPEPFIKNQKEWDHKINLMVEQAPKWDIAMIAGVPAWIQILFQKIIATYKLDSIHDIWPNLSVYVHGGVSFTPYKKSFEKYLTKPLKYFETYLASEGFIAFQYREQSEGMRLVFRNGIYYEFIPFSSENFDSAGNVKESAKAITLEEVQEQVDYAIVISTCSGAWRYILGDTVRFTDLQRFELIITGRTKHYLSLCGEHLSVDNMNDALNKVCDDLQIVINEFTVKGLNIEGGFGHHWYIGVDEEVEVELLKAKLDESLKEINDDYRVERMFALKYLNVTLLPNEVFIKWMKKRGKVGAQNKFPRVMNDQLYKDWIEFVKMSSEMK